MSNFSSKNFIGSLEGSWASGSDEKSNIRDSGSKDLNVPVSKGSDSSPSVMRSDCVVRGAFESKGDLVLDGTLEGDLVVGGVLHVLESASIRANIRAGAVVSFGKIVGDIYCNGKIELHTGAQVRGNLKTRRLLIQDGVIFDGHCEMVSDEAFNDYESDEIDFKADS